MNRQVRLLPRFESHEQEFRQEWERSHPTEGRWEEIRLGYRLGWEAGVTLGERDWDEVEPQLAARFSEDSVGRWRQYRDVVRLGYERGQLERCRQAA